MRKKEKKTYYFTVEGETEKWYLNWLQKLVNEQENTKYIIKIKSSTEDPVKFVKKLTIFDEINITHLIDVEGYELMYQNQFNSNLKRLEEAENLGRKVEYNLGYSNLTFELWIILHKMEFNKPLSKKEDYLRFINQAYNENFKNLTFYKKEREFNKILSKLTINDVLNAINRAGNIMYRLKSDGAIPKNHGRFDYFIENPSLSIWKSIKTIFEDCCLLNS